MTAGKILQFQQTDKNSLLALKADRALAQLAAQGDREAFKNIVETNKQRMFTVAKSVVNNAATAEDVVQESFIKAYRALPNFRGESRLSTWLHRITYLTAIDFSRQLSRHLKLADNPDPNEDVADMNPASKSETEIESRQLQDSINKALLALSDFEQTVFTLRHMQNFKLKEIAIVLDRSEGTIKNILFRAIRKLRDQLGEAQLISVEIEN